jgi:dimethylargininase
VVRIDEAPGLPDSVFVEDAAVVCDEAAVIMRSGAESRRPETPAVSDVLRRYRTVYEIHPPATIDGGDVLVAGRTVFVGQTRRTNADAVRQMRDLFEPHGYTVRAVTVTGCLHLKSAVTALTEDCLLMNPAWVPRHAFAGFDAVDVDAGEPAAANIVRAGGQLIYASGFPRTRTHLERRGLDVHVVDVTELAKAEAAVTCCSLIFPIQPNLTKT